MKQPHKKTNSLEYLRGDKKIKTKLTMEETFVKKEEEDLNVMYKKRMG